MPFLRPQPLGRQRDAERIGLVAESAQSLDVATVNGAERRVGATLVGLMAGPAVVMGEPHGLSLWPLLGLRPPRPAALPYENRRKRG